MVSKSIHLGSEVLINYEKLTKHFENKANWIIGVASIIFIFSLSNYEKFTGGDFSRWGLIVILVGCAFSILNLTNMIVPSILNSNKKKKEKEKLNIFNFKNLSRNLTEEELISYIEKNSTNNSELSKQFGRAIHQIASRRLPYLSKRLKIGGWSLIYSSFIGSILILLETFL